ncbi:MAG: M13 family metallopeptidase [Pyrinomonadaceae bacterium]
MRKILFFSVLILSAAVLIFAVGGNKSRAAATNAIDVAVSVVETQNIHGFDIANLDRSASACENFFQFADGGWVASNPIPAAYARWGKFEELAQKNQLVLRQILETSAKNRNAKPGGLEQKVGDFYSSCMDEQTVEAAGIKPLLPEFEQIAAIKDLPALEDQIARMHNLGFRVVFSFAAAQDFKKSTDVIAQAAQGGLGMPDRDYYVKDDERSEGIRKEYQKHVAKMFELAGDSREKAAEEATTVFDFEKKLADASKTRVERRDAAANYNKLTISELNQLTPHFDWIHYLTDREIPKISVVNVGQPNFFKAVDSLIASESLENWKTYLRWHVLNTAASLLSSPFVQEDFHFNGQILSGTKELQPRWKRCVAVTDEVLGEALGQFYVEKTFTAETKARALKMVMNLIAALRDDLSTLSWMGDTTRARAIAKLEAYTRKIGYPDKWKNYEALAISRDAYADNVRRGAEFELRRNLRKIGQPVDRTEWGMTPPTVNAYYNPLMNEIVFPAGIMQPPFYDPLADDAVNYGGMGAVIGHEMTHGFDDQGARFDAGGNLFDWWTLEDFTNFRQRTDCVVKQFDSFEAEPGLHLQGKLVVGESVADLGGLTVAYRAFKKAEAGKPQKLIDGFTPEQRFFLGWAQVWSGSTRPEEARRRVITDPHPLSRFRVNGPLSNMPAFAEAFQCKAGDAMVRPPEQRCQIW